MKLEDLKCCGNCSYRQSETGENCQDGKNRLENIITAKGYCKAWQWDKLKREDREK